MAENRDEVYAIHVSSFMPTESEARKKPLEPLFVAACLRYVSFVLGTHPGVVFLCLVSGSWNLQHVQNRSGEPGSVGVLFLMRSLVKLLHNVLESVSVVTVTTHACVPAVGCFDLVVLRLLLGQWQFGGDGRDAKTKQVRGLLKLFLLKL